MEAGDRAGEEHKEEEEDVFSNSLFKSCVHSLFRLPAETTFARFRDEFHSLTSAYPSCFV